MRKLPKDPDLGADRLRELLHYDQSTGIFTWRARKPKATVAVGAEAGYLHNGYRVIGIDRRHSMAHRLAWLYVHGEWPKSIIDHIDGNPSNNAIANLREASPSINSQNVRAPRSSSNSGYLGVSLHKQTGKWMASIRVGGKTRHLGIHATRELAAEAYLAAKRLCHEGCTI